ncbi:hypothetical protein [Achromobacter insolitus]|uniref:hypothetical protein n=1 Tax=Achromobacter insolitus TaxID=217204 RepID=UPI0007C35F7D|nr:hypothetical protein [Achromobacter insolitus]OAD16481.1 hypothetical protein A3839_28440 [Achromobacter insolitus]
MTAATCQKVREHVLGFMSTLPGIGAVQDEGVMVRADGVREFGRQWTVRDDASGMSLSASLSDRDDVIEFGLLQRDGDTTVNVLYATLVLDDDEVLLNVVSEASMEFNFDAKVDESRLQRLQETLQFYAAHLGEGSSATAH